MGTVLSCIPGSLAFVETEDERFILERHNPVEKREYIRFVVGRKDEDSGVEQGIFQAVARAVEWKSVTGADADELDSMTSLVTGTQSCEQGECYLQLFWYGERGCVLLGDPEH